MKKLVTMTLFALFSCQTNHVPSAEETDELTKNKKALAQQTLRILDLEKEARKLQDELSQREEEIEDLKSMHFRETMEVARSTSRAERDRCALSTSVPSPGTPAPASLHESERSTTEKPDEPATPRLSQDEERAIKNSLGTMGLPMHLHPPSN